MADEIYCDLHECEERGRSCYECEKIKSLAWVRRKIMKITEVIFHKNIAHTKKDIPSISL